MTYASDERTRERFCPMHGKAEAFTAPHAGYTKEPGCVCPMRPFPKAEDTFTIKGRRKAAGGRTWSAQSGIVGCHGLTPREARTRLIRHAALMADHGWSVVGINRAEITLETPTGARYELRMTKDKP